MREIRTSGSEGGGTGNSTGSSYPYHSRFYLSRVNLSQHHVFSFRYQDYPIGQVRTNRDYRWYLRCTAGIIR